MDYAPIVMFVYNRADHFSKTYEALSKCPEAKNSILYIFSDGAKNEKAVPQVQQVRKTVEDFANRNDFKEVIITESHENKGLANSVISGVSEVINNHGSVIVVEDDCVPSKFFLHYMNAALIFYKNDKRVGSIAGYTPPIDFPEAYKSDVFAAYRSCSWGWATWKEVWNEVDWDLTYIGEFYREPQYIKKLNSFGNDRFLRLYRNTITNANSWSIKFGAHHIKNDLLTIYPRYSYISNIGCDESGVHSKAADSEKLKVYLSKAIPEPHFEPVEVDPDIQKSFKKVYSGGKVSDIKRYFATKYIIFKEKRKKSV